MSYLSKLPPAPTGVILPPPPNHFLGANVPTHPVVMPQKTKKELQTEYNILLYEIYKKLINSCKINPDTKNMNDKLINLANQINSFKTNGGTKRKNIYNTRKRKNKKRVRTRRKNN